MRAPAIDAQATDQVRAKLVRVHHGDVMADEHIAHLTQHLPVQRSALADRHHLQPAPSRLVQVVVLVSLVHHAADEITKTAAAETRGDLQDRAPGTVDPRRVAQVENGERRGRHGADAG